MGLLRASKAGSERPGGNTIDQGSNLQRYGKAWANYSRPRRLSSSFRYDLPTDNVRPLFR
jgi:hypothetical protein